MSCDRLRGPLRRSRTRTVWRAAAAAASVLGLVVGLGGCVDPYGSGSYGGSYSGSYGVPYGYPSNPYPYPYGYPYGYPGGSYGTYGYPDSYGHGHHEHYGRDHDRRDWDGRGGRHDDGSFHPGSGGGAPGFQGGGQPQSPPPMVNTPPSPSGPPPSDRPRIRSGRGVPTQQGEPN